MTSVGDYAFSVCTSLTEVHIPDSVTSVGAYTFSECTSLTEVHISNQLDTISTALFSGCKSLETKNFPQNLTKIKDPDLGNLLKSMMHLNASMRPSAKDVLDKLKEIRKEKASKPSEPTGTSAPPKPFMPFKPTASTKSGFCEPWPEHKIVFDKTKLTSMGFVSSAQVLVFGKQAYEFFRENGISRKYSVEQLLSRGLAKNAADSAGSESTVSGSDLTDDFCDPWPEHNIEFIPSEITRMHYISSRKAEIFGKKVYEFFRSNGVSRKYTAEQAVASGLAKIK